MEWYIALIHSNMKPPQILVEQAFYLTAERFPHRHRSAITADFIYQSQETSKRLSNINIGSGVKIQEVSSI